MTKCPDGGPHLPKCNKQGCPVIEGMTHAEWIEEVRKFVTPQPRPKRKGDTDETVS